MKKCLLVAVLALCFCACDNEVKEYTTQCESDEQCEKECNEGNGAACYGTRNYRKSCDLKYALGCYKLVNVIERRDGIEKAKEYYKKAFKMLEKSCENNHNGKSCDALADMYKDGEWVEKDESKAVFYYKKGCEFNYGWACKGLGDMYFKGKGVEKDAKKALNYHQKACDLDLGDCYWIGVLNEGQDNQKAVSFYKQGCDRDDSGSCKKLGDMYFKGKGVEKDAKKALSYHQKACDLDKLACRNAGWFYHNKKEYQKAISFYKQGCDRDDSFSCSNLGDMYFEGVRVKQDFSKAFEYHKKSGYSYGMADKYIKKKRYKEAKYFMEKECGNNCFNKGLESANNKDYIKARLYYEIACDKGNAGACNNLGVLYVSGRGVAKNNAKAKALYEKACNMNEAIACDNVGGYYYNAREFAKAKAAFEKGCEGNKADSCSNLGVLYEFGEGVRQDFSQAKAYYGKGCDGGSQRGCDGYRKLNQRGVK